MALNDLEGIVVAGGTWLYDGVIHKRTLVIARSYDVKWATYQADGLLEEGELPATPGADGIYYYVSGTGPFPSIAAAKAWAEQAWGPVVWDA
jgi:hypothetical protein